VPSARRAPRFAVLALCGVLAAGSLAGCETTQEKAAAQRAESERILDARAKRQAQKKKYRRAHDKNQDRHEKGEG
jgi:hypothetical protein